MTQNVSPTPRGAIYARNSTRHQERQETIQSQLLVLRERMANDGVPLACAPYTDEGYSASLLARPALDRLLDDAAARRFDVVYITDRDRLSRPDDPGEGYYLRSEIQKHGVRLVFLTGNSDGTAEGDFREGIEDLLASYERAKFKERSQRGKRRMLAEGRISRPNPPYGLAYTPIDHAKGQPGQWSINEAEAPLVRQMYAWAVAGHSLGWIARELNERGVPTRSGATWWPATVGGILRNAVYRGEWVSQRQEAIEAQRAPKPGVYRRKKKTSHRERPPEDWEHTPAPHLALVDPQTWEAAQHQIARNSQLSPRNTKRPYLLQSLLVCGYPLEGGTGEETCGHVWAASSDRTRPGWLRYRCYRRYGHGHDGHGCGGWMRATEIEDIVWGWVSAFVTNPAQVLRDMEERAQRGRQSRAGAERAVTLALSRVKRAENALDTLNLKNVTGSLSDEEHARLRPTLLAALEQARLALAEAQERAQQAQVTEATQAEVEAFCREARLVLAAPSFEEKRQLVRALVQRVVVSEQTIEIQVRLRSARLAREGTDCKSGVTALTTATT